MKHRHKKCALLAKIRKNAESRRGAIMQLPKPQEEELNSKSYLSSDQFQETSETLRAMRKKRKRVIKKRRSNEIEKKSRRKTKIEAKASDAKESNSQEGKSTVEQSTTLSPSPMKKIKLQRNRSSVGMLCHIADLNTQKKLFFLTQNTTSYTAKNRQNCQKYTKIHAF